VVSHQFIQLFVGIHHPTVMSRITLRGRRLPLLALTAEDRETLESWSARRKTAQALDLRSRIILRASTGLTATAVAAELGICIHTVSKWCRRYATVGPDGLLDEARPGRFAWAARFRRLARDYERLDTTLKGLHLLAFATLMLRNLTKTLASSS
jgi:hypothetical protein